ncbi:MAG: lysophospholipase, partial [Thiovulaceae bacterium]|nr:lysophospholipase [Sulfurimonadaceae bacterium]
FTQSWETKAPLLGVIVLIHGLGEYSGRYVELADHFTKHGYHVHTFDLRGHGKSEGKKGHTPSYDCLMHDIEQFYTLVQDTYPNLPLFLYGHSLGGNLAINFLLRKVPDITGVIATSPALRSNLPTPLWKHVTALILRAIWPSFTVSSGIKAKHVTRSISVEKYYEKDPLVHKQISVELGLSILESGKWAIEHAHEIHAPLYVIHGTEDKITSPLASEEFIQKANETSIFFHLYEGMAHELHNEPEREKVLKNIIAWLDARCA